ATVLERRTEVDAIRRGFGTSSLAELVEAAGLEPGDVREAARAFAGAKLASVIYGRQLADARDGASAIAALANLAELAGQAGRPGHVFLEAVENANTWGARDMGVLPGSGPGYAKAAPGMDTPAMLRALADGKLRAAYVMGANPLVDYPDADLAMRA